LEKEERKRPEVEEGKREEEAEGALGRDRDRRVLGREIAALRIMLGRVAVRGA